MSTAAQRDVAYRPSDYVAARGIEGEIGRDVLGLVGELLERRMVVPGKRRVSD
jgi:hypothetical protein